MKITIKGTKMELTESIKDSVNEKIGSLQKFSDNITEAHVEVGKTSNHHQKGDVFFCEVNLKLPGKGIRAREQKDDLYVAINSAKEICQREIKEYKEKMRNS